MNRILCLYIYSKDEQKILYIFTLKKNNKLYLYLYFNPIKAGGGAFGAPPPYSFFALALSFVTLSPWNFLTFQK